MYVILVFACLLPALPIMHWICGFFRGDATIGDVPENIRVMSPEGLKSLLGSANSQAVAYAVQTIGNRNDVTALPQLIKLLNRTEPLQLPHQERHTSQARLARAALVNMIRTGVIRDPGNVGLLRPYFDVARHGTPAEQQALIAILGEVREPLGIPLLSEISSAGQPHLQIAARAALAETIDPERSNLVGALRQRIEPVMYLFGLAVLVGFSVWMVLAWLIRGVDMRLMLLLCVSVALMGWFAGLVITDFSRSVAVDQAIEKAVRSHNIMALKTMIYHDNAPYPGDSYVAWHLVRKGDADTVYCLARLPSVGPDDNELYKKLLRERIDWILSRIVASKLGTSSFTKLARSNVREVRAAVAATLGRLRVRNEKLIGALERLSNDEDEEVKKKASEALARVKAYPIWTWYNL